MYNYCDRMCGEIECRACTGDDERQEHYAHDLGLPPQAPGYSEVSRTQLATTDAAGTVYLVEFTLDGDGAWWTITREGIALGRAQRLPWALAIVQSISQEDATQ